MVIEVRVPDIGDYHDIPVIDILVQTGQQVAAEDPLITLESDKATMDIPAPRAGTVRELRLKNGDKVSQGSVILLLEESVTAGHAVPPPAAAPAAASTAVPALVPPVAAETASTPAAVPAAGNPLVAASPAGGAAALTVAVPDIGDYQDIPVIDILVKVGDMVAAEDALITLESDKATMDVPSPAAGVVQRILLALGDKVSQGHPILELAGSEAAAGAPAVVPPAAPAASSVAAAPPALAAAVPAPAVAAIPPTPAQAQPAGSSAAPAAIDFSGAHASPGIRRLARELGVDLNQVKGSGPKERITEEDVKLHVKRTLEALASRPPAAGAAGSGGLDLLPWPQVDFTRFGEVEVRPLSRIKKISGANLHRNWVRIPHVTNQDEADITDLEALRNQLNAEQGKGGVKVTALAFLIKAVTVALREFPDFNASLDGDNLVLKRYCHIGFAADTPNGLVVPVLKNADRKGVFEIARESAELAARAREGKLGPADMQGGCFSISSLGGIGGGHFTPIINAPEVAILGVGRSALRPVWDGAAFVPRLMLPLSLSYDHRVIDGASAARFNALLARLLADMRRALL